ncbi:GntR family transcriptional regulator [Sphingomonas sp. CL5.1]|uniref:GntR family transcriptional regulator n=1 Tax=Sphingomonas sp. CL5.1 TaxID=2653203 RepID=UPI001583BBE7|nr:GntR family transcriptional regulator [Sphingomonas sp. CL5.1]QKS00605.1 GntR family transcriptional regulator [Sphingomonas sp. CL5.1]
MLQPAEDNGRVQLSNWVAAKLREQIVSGQIKSGQFLRIDAVAKSLDVSMTPVREGLLMLQSESYVRLIPRRGFMVNGFSRQDLLDLFWAQATIGAELARRATTRMTDEQIAEMEGQQRAYETAIASDDKPQIDRLGHVFHRAINLAADSPRLALLLGSLTKQLPNRFYATIEGQLMHAMEYHPIILNAIKLRDPEAAASLMFRHIVLGGEGLVATLDRQGLWDDDSTPEPKGKKASKERRARS